jgi:hypothetical protein
MSTTSQHVGYKIPDGSDPFLRTDFVQNLNLQDQYTGDWICTSTTRPAWGSGQAGMKIVETDTRRTLMWTGTTFREMLYGPAVWWGSIRPNATISHGTVVSYTVGTFTVNRPGTLLGFANTEYAMPNTGYIGASTRVTIDGAVASWDTSGVDFIETNFPSGGTDFWGVTIPAMGVRNISAGTHSVGIQILGTVTGTNTLKIVSNRTLAMFVNATDR